MSTYPQCSDTASTFGPKASLKPKRVPPFKQLKCFKNLVVVRWKTSATWHELDNYSMRQELLILQNHSTFWAVTTVTSRHLLYLEGLINNWNSQKKQSFISFVDWFAHPKFWPEQGIRTQLSMRSIQTGKMSTSSISDNLLFKTFKRNIYTKRLIKAIPAWCNRAGEKNSELEWHVLIVDPANYWPKLHAAIPVIYCSCIQYSKAFRWAEKR